MPDENNPYANITSLIDLILDHIDAIVKAEIYTQQTNNGTVVEVVPADFFEEPLLFDTISNSLKTIADNQDYIIKLFSTSNQKFIIFSEKNSFKHLLETLYKNLINLEKTLKIIIPNAKPNVDNQKLKDLLLQIIDYLNLSKDLSPILYVLDTYADKIDEVQKKLNNVHTDSSEYLNQQGLCKSFNKRSTMLKEYSDKWWDRILYILFILFILLFFSMYDFLSITPENIDFILKKHIFFIPFTIILFWFLWLTTKKHLFYSRLADDYNYKNDLSMAYYGYKNEILPTDEDLLKGLDADTLKDAHMLRLKLLDNVLANITKNPIESGLKADTSPYTEIIGKLLDQVKKEK